MKCGTFVLLVFGCLTPLGCGPQPALTLPHQCVAPRGHAMREPDDVSACLATLIKDHNLPGMVAVIVNQNNIVEAGAAGVRERGRRERVTVNDQFEINSETKAMTATLCAMLVEEGKLRWDSTLADIFPALRPEMQPALATVTLKQLLTQRSGLASKGPLANWQHLMALEGAPEQTRHTLLRDAIKLAPDAAPGSRFVYNNLNYAIAGHMAEMAAGRSWEALMRERLFVPLEMGSAGFGPPGSVGTFAQPHGHDADGRPDESHPMDRNEVPPALAPAGAVHCSVLDWARFAALHATQGESHPGLLKRESFVELQSPVTQSLEEPDLKEIAPTAIGYAMGWIVLPHGLLVHGGSNGRWMAKAAIIPRDRLAVLVICNEGGDAAEEACNRAVATLIHNYYRLNGLTHAHTDGEPATPPQPHPYRGSQNS